MINFKKGVKLARDGEVVKTHTIQAMSIVADIYTGRGYKGILNTVTSVMDGKHMANSLHYKGEAFDQRTWKNINGEQMCEREKYDISLEIKERLGEDWDVVVESTHIHVEHDPNAI